MFGPGPFRWRDFQLVLVLLLVLALAILTVRYFVLTLLTAWGVALLLESPHRTLSRRLGGRPGAAAAAIVFLTTFLILLPGMVATVVVAQQLGGFVDWLRPHLTPAAMEQLLTERLAARFPATAAWLAASGPTLATAAMASVVDYAAAGARAIVPAILGGALQALVDLMLFVMMLFYLLMDGDAARDAVRGISPLTRGQETELTMHLVSTMRGAIQSLVVVPLVQAVAAFGGYWVLGLPNPLLWAVMTALSAVVPVVGTPAVWIPAVLYLFVEGSTSRALAMLAWGVLVVSGVDNVIKPLILRGAARIHPMLGFVFVLGGTWAFGLQGLLAGPVALSLVVTAYRIYRYDVLRWRAPVSTPA